MRKTRHSVAGGQPDLEVVVTVAAEPAACEEGSRASGNRRELATETITDSPLGPSVSHHVRL